MQKTGAKGNYAFTTSPPGVYPGRPPHIHFKVSVPGHEPLTLYYEQWIRLLDTAVDLRAFLEENKSRLKLKSES